MLVARAARRVVAAWMDVDAKLAGWREGSVNRIGAAGVTLGGIDVAVTGRTSKDTGLLKRKSRYIRISPPEDVALTMRLLRDARDYLARKYFASMSAYDLCKWRRILSATRQTGRGTHLSRYRRHALSPSVGPKNNGA
jgi:hypothetical protein